MINIGLLNNNGSIVPTMKIDGQVNLTTLELSYILHLLENGAYAKILRSKLHQSIPSEQMVGVEEMLSKMSFMTQRTNKESKSKMLLEMAKTPVIQPTMTDEN